MKETEASYAYYRRCQTVMKNGEQCRCPAQKGSDTCQNHEQQREQVKKRTAAQMAVLRAAAEKMTSRTGRKHSREDVLRSVEGMMAVMDEIGEAMLDSRLDVRGAREMLLEVQKAMLADTKACRGLTRINADLNGNSGSRYEG